MEKEKLKKYPGGGKKNWGGGGKPCDREEGILYVKLNFDFKLPMKVLIIVGLMAHVSVVWLVISFG